MINSGKPVLGGHALANQLPDAVERAYQRGSHFAKHAALMAEWVVYCAAVPADALDSRSR